jgi:hypothetical protein
VAAQLVATNVQSDRLVYALYVLTEAEQALVAGAGQRTCAHRRVVAV